MTDRLFKTEQEAFWAGAFGNEYNIRNRGDQLIASNISVFSRALRRAEKPASCIEFGANIGLNLRALKLLYPEQEQYAVEINPEAAATLRSTAPWVRVFESSILDFENCRIRGGGSVTWLLRRAF